MWRHGVPYVTVRFMSLRGLTALPLPVPESPKPGGFHEGLDEVGVITPGDRHADSFGEGESMLPMLGDDLKRGVVAA